MVTTGNSITRVLTIAVVAMLVVGLLGGAPIALASESNDRPNVVMIMADDIGWSDIAAYRRYLGLSDPIPTPNIDRLAAEGMMFTDAHSPASLCAPTRFSMLTGSYPYRNGRQWGTWTLWTTSAFRAGQNHTTAAEIMQSAGYRTGFFGKMHFGGNPRNSSGNVTHTDSAVDYSYKIWDLTTAHGFDYCFGAHNGVQSDPYLFLENDKFLPIDPGKPADNSSVKYWNVGDYPGTNGMGNIPAGHAGRGDVDWNSSQLGRQFTDKTVAYISDCVTNHSDQPFLVYYMASAVHVPHTPPIDFEPEADGSPGSPANVPVDGAVTGGTDFAEMIYELDLQVGKIVNALEDPNRDGDFADSVLADTLIFFTSDNGGLKTDTGFPDYSGNAGLRGNKGQIWEGGHRVPFIARWGDGTAEGSSIAPGTVSRQLICSHDWVGAMYALAEENIAANQAQDCVDILPVLLGRWPDEHPVRDFLFHQSKQYNASYAIRQGDYFLFLNSSKNGTELYNMANDLAQATNLLASSPSQETLDLADEMETLYKTHDGENEARSTTAFKYGAHGLALSSSLDFGVNAVGGTSNLTVILYNVGYDVLSMTNVTFADGTAFSVVGVSTAEVASGTSTNIAVQYAPGTPGKHTDTLQLWVNDVYSSTLEVSLKGQAATTTGVDIAVGTSLDFGLAPTGATSTAYLSVSNTGLSTLTITNLTWSGPDTSLFSIVAGPISIPGMDSTNITVQYNPVAMETNSAVLHIWSDDPDENPVDVSCTGTGGPLPELLVYQPFDYTAGSNLTGQDGNQGAGEGFSGNWVDANKGGYAAAAGSLSYEDENGSKLLTTGNMAGINSAEADASAVLLDLSYAPWVPFVTGGAGSERITEGGTLWVSFLIDDANITDNCVFGLEGDNPDGSAGDAGELRFGEKWANGGGTGDWQLRVGSEEDAPNANDCDNDVHFVVMRLDLTNAAGGDAVRAWLDPLLAGEPLDGDAFRAVTNADISANYLSIKSGGNAGTEFDEVRIGTTYAAVSPHEQAPNITMTPDSLDFGSVSPGSTNDLAVIVTNTGLLALNVTNITLDGADAFTVLEGTPFSLAAGDGTNITVRYAPTNVATHTGSLSIWSNDPDTNPADVSLQGRTGAPPGVSRRWDASSNNKWDTGANWSDNNRPDTTIESARYDRGSAGRTACVMETDKEIGQVEVLSPNDAAAIRPVGPGAITLTLTPESFGGVGIEMGHAAKDFRIAGQAGPMTVALGSGQTWNVDGTNAPGDLDLDHNTYGLTIELGSHTLTNNIGGNRLIDCDAVISGSGSIVKNGTGLLKLSRDNTYSGATVINNGTVQLTSAGALSASPVTIAASGTLAGSGTVSANVSGDGSVSPGTSVDTLTIRGDAGFGTLIIEIDGDAGAADRINVGGELALAGATLNVTELSTADDAAYVIAEYDSLTGVFSDTNGLPTGYTVDYNYSGTGQIAIMEDAADPNDTDEDGIGDAWELAYWGSLTNANETSASDTDAHSDLEEYIADTDPTNSASFFCLKAIAHTDSTRIYFDSSTGRIYTLQFADGLLGGAWSNMPGQAPRTGTGVNDSMTDTNAVKKRYYRIEVQVQ